MLDAVHEQLKHADDAPVREQAYFSGARLDDDQLRAAGQEDRPRRADQRPRQADAVASNVGLGHDIRAGLINPTESQLRALQAIVCHLLARQHRDVIAYGAGWTDPDRQQPVGDTGRREPRQIDTIVDAELQRAAQRRIASASTNPCACPLTVSTQRTVKRGPAAAASTSFWLMW